jgi:mannose-1-phosphate guanylyltransferase
MSEVYAVILAGGQGSRFWPVSRQRRPKQFLSISASGESLFQATARRIEPMCGKDRLLVVTNVMHKPLIEEQVTYAKVIAEPLARNTAASIGLAAISLERKDPQAVMIVLPADHAVTDEAAQRKVLAEAAALAGQKPLLVTIGIKPSSPNTAYGYIKRGQKLSESGYKVGRFFEKPNEERAKKYFESGDFFWNSGQFVWRVEVILRAIEEYMPDLYQALRTIQPALGTDRQDAVVEKAFSGLESVSIDFGVLEHTRNCAVIAAPNFGWNDVGSWDAWAGHFEHDADGNLVRGQALLIDSRGCVVQGNGKMVAVLGAENLIVIDAHDATLVCPRERVQDVRKIVDELKKRGRNDLI